MKIILLFALNIIPLITQVQSATFDFRTVFPGVNKAKFDRLVTCVFSDESMELPIEQVTIEGKPHAVQMIGSNIHPRDFDTYIFSTLANKNILEVGPGLGHTTGLILLTEAAHLTIVEQSKTAIDELTENLKVYQKLAPQGKNFGNPPRFSSVCGSIANPRILLEKKFNIELLINVLGFMSPSQAMASLRNMRAVMIESDESRLYVQMDATPRIKEVFDTYLENRKMGKKYPGYIGYKTKNEKNGAIICCDHIDEENNTSGYPLPLFHTIGVHELPQNTSWGVMKVPTYVKESSSFTADIDTLTRMLNEADFEIVDIYYSKRAYKYPEPLDPTWENFGHELVIAHAKPKLVNPH